MPSSGRSSLQAPLSEPYFLLDESLSSNLISEVFEITGRSIATINDEWPGRDRRNNPIPDEEIFPHLATRAGPRAVWITADRRAFRKHREAIDKHNISILWLRAPGRNPRYTEQLDMICKVIETVHLLIGQSNVPNYLRARLDLNESNRPFLEQLQGSVLERPAVWQRVVLE